MIQSDKNRGVRRSLLKRLLKDGILDDDEIPKQKRDNTKKYRHQRINLNSYFDMCQETNGFQRRYHMSIDSFNTLVHILSKDITINVIKSLNSTSGNDPITKRMIVAMGVRYMGGEKIKSIADIFGTSFPSTNRVVNLFLEAVDKSTHSHLSIDLLPESDLERNRYAMEWNQRSDAFNLYYGLLGAIDGWLCTTERPYDVSNPSDFFLNIIKNTVSMYKRCVMLICVSYIFQWLVQVVKMTHVFSGD